MLTVAIATHIVNITLNQTCFFLKLFWLEHQYACVCVFLSIPKGINTLLTSYKL